MAATAQPEAELDGKLDLRRKAQIAYHRAEDYAGEVIVAQDPDFDLDDTIFKTLEGTLPRLVMKDTLANKLYWGESAIARITEAYAQIAPAPRHDKALIDFMLNDCNFKMEHADGSFMDHLRFCYEYSVANFAQHSPRVLLLHSIMGVATNYFPMELSKLPKLESMLTEFENIHVAAFPSVLRLLNYQELLGELKTCKDVTSLKSLTFHRVIDNREMTIDAEAFWIQLNYQLIHLLDFIPAANWVDETDHQLFEVFIALYELLQRAGKQMAYVDFSLTSIGRAPTTKGMTLGSFINGMVPSAIKSRMRNNAIKKFSSKIGHDLDYKIEWAAAPSRL